VTGHEGDEATPFGFEIFEKVTFKANFPESSKTDPNRM
jgi:hypothetical protein